MQYKRPESVLVVIYTLSGRVLLLKRTDHPDFWQSVTGAMDWEETDPRVTASREVQEETGLDIAPDVLQDLALTSTYAILPQWRHRYSSDVLQNTEYAFAVSVPKEIVPTLSPREHTDYGWFSFDEACAKVWSRTNREALQKLFSDFKDRSSQEKSDVSNSNG